MKKTQSVEEENTMKNAKLILATGNGYPVSTEEQIPLIKKAGFDGVFTVEYSGDNVFDTTILGAKRIIELLESIKAGKA